MLVLMSPGISVKAASLQMTVSLPFLHMQEHPRGHSGPPGGVAARLAAPLSETSRDSRRNIRHQAGPGAEIRADIKTVRYSIGGRALPLSIDFDIYISVPRHIISSKIETTTLMEFP